MNTKSSEIDSRSYFWSCITISDDCPFFSASDPNLYYFGVGLMSMYVTFLFTVLADLNFYNTIDNFQQRIDYCINYVRKKLCLVKIDQGRLMSAQERTEKQIKRSEECTKIVQALREALFTDNASQMEALTHSASTDNLYID